jgi:N-carbamoylsarcosine amidase
MTEHAEQHMGPKIDEQELQTILSRVFATDSALYKDRGFQRRIGYGRKPALINIDLANAWTQPGNPFACVGMETIIPAVQQLLAAFRARNLPVVYTTTAYEVSAGPNTDMGLWHMKIPAEVLKADSKLVEIDERIKPLPGEHVIVKKRASAFHGTHLAGMLRALGVDTVIVTGTTASACVRNTVEDAIADGFRPIVPRETVGDRILGAVEWNLFDIDAKFGDVEPLERVLAYLKSNDIG